MAKKSGKDFIADQRYYLDKEGNVVGEKDPNKLTLLVAEGGRLPHDEAKKYGLTGKAAEHDEDEGEATDAAPEHTEQPLTPGATGTGKPPDESGKPKNPPKAGGGK